MTVALAYNATSHVPWLEEGEGAAEDLAVVWAIVRLAESMPASVEDRCALNQARKTLRELAAALGTDEAGMEDSLHRRYERLRERGAQEHKAWFCDPPA